jgi:hypothetical protein
LKTYFLSDEKESYFWPFLMISNMTINLNDLKQIVDMVFSSLNQSNELNIEVNADFYWDIPDEELYNPYKNPDNLTLGQLSFDLEELNRLLQKDEVITHDLKRLSTVLRFLSIVSKPLV